MIDDKDVKKIVEAMKGVFPTMEEMKEVFPTAEMMKNSFDSVEKRMATKEQLENLGIKVDKIDGRLKNVEQKLEDIGDLRPRVKKLEEALELE